MKVQVFKHFSVHFLLSLYNAYSHPPSVSPSLPIRFPASYCRQIERGSEREKGEKISWARHRLGLDSKKVIPIFWWAKQVKNDVWWSKLLSLLYVNFLWMFSCFEMIVSLLDWPTFLLRAVKKETLINFFCQTCTFQRNILFTWFPAFYCLSHIFLSSTRSWHKPASRRVLFVFWNFHLLPPPLRKKKKGPSCWERGKTPEKRFLLSLGLLCNKTRRNLAGFVLVAPSETTSPCILMWLVRLSLRLKPLLQTSQM